MRQPPSKPTGPGTSLVVVPETAPRLWSLEAEARRGPASAARLDPGTTRVLAALLLIVAYLALCTAPLLAINAWDTDEPKRPFLIELSVALGYLGLSMLVLQFLLMSRIRWLTAPFGIDILHRFHKEVSFVALGLIFTHPILLVAEDAGQYLPLLDVAAAPWRARFGSLATLLLVALMVVSACRARFRLSYEVWKLSHGTLGVGAIFLALAHMNGVGHYTGGTIGRGVMWAAAGGLMLALSWSRVVKPMIRLHRPWRVVRVVRERGRAVTLVVEPVGHGGIHFRPGQFAWVTVGGSPLSVTREHPLSFSSPGAEAADGAVALTVKARGDWTHSLGSLEPGARLYLDGPYGSFTIDRQEALGYVFIAGGVGITPIYSMLATMCLREESRPVILFYLSRTWESVIFREQLAELASYMPNLELVHVLEQADGSWRGEVGSVRPELLGRHLPRRYRELAYFLCAANPVMDVARNTLLTMGVPGYRVRCERFAEV